MDSGRELLQQYRVDGTSVYFDDELVRTLRRPDDPKDWVANIMGAILIDLIERLHLPHSMTLEQLVDHLGLSSDAFIDAIALVAVAGV